MTANQASSVKWQNTAISLFVKLVKVRSPGKEETEVVVGETVVNVEAGAGVVGVEVVDGEAGAGVVDVEPGAKVVGVEAVDGGLGGLERSPPSPHPPSVGLILKL